MILKEDPMRRATAVLLLSILLTTVQGVWPTAARAETGDISVGGVWVCRLTQGAGGLTVEQRVRRIDRRMTDILSQPDVRRRRLTVEVKPSGAAAEIVAADVTIMTVTPADAAGTGVSSYELANQWAGRFVRGLRRALPGREIVGLMYTQPRGTGPREVGRIVGFTWYWRRTARGDGAQVEPSDPRRYTVQFTSNRRVAVRADCNRGTGTYELSGRTITISRLGMTKMMCSSGSLDQRFLADLQAAATFTVRAGVLLLDLGNGSGTMRFSRVLP
jgi:heat shock protein HslJ